MDNPTELKWASELISRCNNDIDEFISYLNDSKIIPHLNDHMTQLAGRKFSQPEDVLSELIILQANLATNVKRPFLNLFNCPYTLPEFVPMEMQKWFSLLYQAVPIFWLNDFRLAAINAPPLPEHVFEPSMVPLDTMYWSWESNLYNEEDPVLGNALSLSLAKSPEGLHLLTIGDGKEAGDIVYGSNNLVFIPSLFAKWGQEYPGDMNKEQRRSYESVVKMFGFMNSKNVTSDSQKPTRKWRRRVSDTLNTKIHFINLRRPEKSKSYANKGNEIDWNWRWIVQGHWRNQYFPSEGSHKIMYIAPYEKGPEEKPLKPVVMRVNK